MCHGRGSNLCRISHTLRGFSPQELPTFDGTLTVFSIPFVMLYAMPPQLQVGGEIPYLLPNLDRRREGPTPSLKNATVTNISWLWPSRNKQQQEA